jgi:outer membrane immunogenic protein
VSGSDSVDFWGYTVGGGMEYAFSEALSGRIEYRYTDLGKEDFDSSPFECIPACQFEGSLDFHAVRAGLSWHFGAM